MALENSLFSYRKGKTPLHKMSAGIKLLLLFILCIFTFFKKTPQAVSDFYSLDLIIPVFSCFFFSFLLFFLGGANFKSILKLKFVFFIGFFVTAFSIFSIPENLSDEQKKFIMNFYSIKINLNALASGLLYTLRFFITTFSAQTIFETTSSLEIKSALENAQEKIAKIIPPVKKLNPALSLTLAINFIPEIFETWNKVHMAALARSNTGKRKTLKNSVETLFRTIQSLLSCLLFYAETKRKALLNRS